jgi:hypothetical protein
MALGRDAKADAAFARGAEIIQKEEEGAREVAYDQES